MEINVTALLDQDCSLLSASQAELGPNAGEITWRNALALAERMPLATDENREAIRDHFRAYGAWDTAEVDAWTDAELSAMVWQEGAADMRELEDYCDGCWKKYQKKAEAGSISGRLSRAKDGAVYLYIGC